MLRPLHPPLFTTLRRPCDPLSGSDRCVGPFLP